MERTPTGAECRERNAMSMLSQCVSERSAQSLERHSSLLFRLGCKNLKNGSSLIDYAVSHTAHDVGKNLDYAGAWYVEARFSAVASVIAAVQDYKANATLITLVLRFNKVGDASAIALADALQATVSACGHMLFQECAFCCHRCCFAK